MLVRNAPFEECLEVLKRRLHGIFYVWAACVECIVPWRGASNGEQRTMYVSTIRDPTIRNLLIAAEASSGSENWMHQNCDKHAPTTFIQPSFWVPYDLKMVGAWEADGVSGKAA